MSAYKKESLEDRQDRQRAKEAEKLAKNSGSAGGRLKQNLGDIGYQLRIPDIIQNILYLMVVDLPTEEQMVVARKSVKPDVGRAVKTDNARSVMV